MFTYAAKTPADTGRRLRWVSGGELALGVSTDITNTDADYIGRETKCRLGRRYTVVKDLLSWAGGQTLDIPGCSLPFST